LHVIEYCIARHRILYVSRNRREEAVLGRPVGTLRLLKGACAGKQAEFEFTPANPQKQVPITTKLSASTIAKKGTEWSSDEE
jgi:hypothetical protein